ncbi:molybdate ABC transporter substrate-binding protein [Salinarimonas chemoclinalis]|uniref:molybdate ABC transporter substrate-binding protein n=1 Tax=Salinarimonas chemoclinalis TaxID=3241599 RepID=UPI0035567ACC
MTRHAPRLALLATLAAALTFAAPAAWSQDTRSQTAVVFAAASLKNALDDAAAAFRERTGAEIALSYAGSSALARQIEQGAPADLFVSASVEWMDHLAAAGLIREESRVDLLGNRIALVAPAASEVEIAIAPGFDLAGALGPDGRLAMAETTAVPAGVYGRAALEHLGVWGSVADRLAQSENVRAALALVSRGEVPLGIVYTTDATADDDVRVVALFPEETHPPIVYPAALTRESESAVAADFLAFLRTPEARPLFGSQGFAVLVD